VSSRETEIVAVGTAAVDIGAVPCGDAAADAVDIVPGEGPESSLVLLNVPAGSLLVFEAFLFVA